MEAIIRLNVPEWQIGQTVSVYFPDTMMKKGVCEQEISEIVTCEKCQYGREACGNIKCNRPGNEPCSAEYHPVTWFCADGKRR